MSVNGLAAQSKNVFYDTRRNDLESIVVLCFLVDVFKIFTKAIRRFFPARPFE